MNQSLSSVKKLLHGTFLLIALLLWVNMGETEKDRTNTVKNDEPHFVPLEEGEGNYAGVIHDEKTRTNLFNLSIFGNTKVGGILKESDDSFNQLKLSDLKEINIDMPTYQSTRYKDREFTLLTIKTTTGQVIKDLLAPRNIIICGIEKESKIEKAWFLYKINKIEITGHIESKQVTTESINIKKEAPAQLAKVSTETKKEEIGKEEKNEIKKKLENQAQETVKNASGTSQLVINQELPSKELEEKLEQQEKAFNAGKKPQTIFAAFINIIDAVINLLRVIISKFSGFLGF